MRLDMNYQFDVLQTIMFFIAEYEETAFIGKNPYITLLDHSGREAVIEFRTDPGTGELVSFEMVASKSSVYTKSDLNLCHKIDFIGLLNYFNKNI